MSFPELCIKRPVMTTLLMAAFILFGLSAYRALPVSELPNVDFPTISVSASLPGASPETMASAVATPLEGEFSNIDGISSMSSSSSLGKTSITLQFDLDKDINAAAQDVQAAISAAGRELPNQMPSPPTFRKVNPADSPILYISLSSTYLPLSEVDEYAETMLAKQISTISGVAQVNIYGSQKYAVRVQVDPDALAARNIGIDEVAAAVAQSNVNLPTGTFDNAHKSMTILSTGQLTDAHDFMQQTVMYRNGAPVKLGDIALVKDSVENNKVANWYNGTRSIVLAIQRQPGSNTIDVVNRIRDILPRFEAGLPAGIKLNVMYDRSKSIRASVADVQFTLILAAMLVVLVIFLFLRNLSATIIPSIALPVSIIGTFAVMYMLHYNLDNLSLMALTLSVGFVVDDAIVMLENIMRHVEAGMRPWDAAIKGSREIGFTIISMTMSLAAVFIPVLFMGGVVGRLLHEFSVTICAAIFVSGIVSLSLTPMMCSRFIKAHKKTEKHGNAYRRIETFLNNLSEGYRTSLAWCLARPRMMLGVFAFTIVATGVLFMLVPKSFIPSEDTGRLMILTQGADDASFEAMEKYQQVAAKVVGKNKSVEGVMSVVGAGGASSGASGRMFLILKPRNQRNTSADQLASKLRRQLADIPGIRGFVQNPPVIRVGGHMTQAEYQYTMQGLNITELFSWAGKMTQKISQLPGIKDVSSDATNAGTSLDVTINRARAAALGITPQQIEEALGSAFGNQQVSTIYTQLDQYEVILEVLPRFQRDPSALNHLYLRSSISGALVPLDTVVNIKTSPAPLTINHSGQLPSVTISFNLSPETSIGTAVDEIDSLAGQMHLPDTISTGFEGTAQAFQSSLQGLGLLLLMAVLVVYIVLGILYESFIHPLTILSGLPAAGMGALLTLLVFHVSLSLYAFVGIIMLVGIVKKNAIMMIDFALEKQRHEHMPPHEAIQAAALIRFRPIMMTTMAALVGSLPIAIGVGEGSESREPLGLAVVGGLMVSQALTLYLTPVIYIYMDRLSHWHAARSAKREARLRTTA